MTTSETRKYEMLERVRKFGQDNPSLFPDSTEGGRAFATIAAAVTELTAHIDAKRKSATEGRRAKVTARRALLDGLRAVGRTARVIGKRTPEFDDRFRMEQPSKQTDQALLSAGRVFAEQAEAMKDRFISHGMPDSFIDDLKRLVEEFRQAINSREAGKHGNNAAQAAITAALSESLAAVQTLDVIVANQLPGKPVLKAVWDRDRKIDFSRRSKSRTRGRSQAPASEPVTPAVPAAPVTTTATAPAAANPTSAMEKAVVQLEVVS